MNPLLAFVGGLVRGTFIGALVLLACPVTGKGGDPLLNREKNRTAAPSSYQAMTVANLLKLQQPKAWHVGNPRRPEENHGVALTGYLLKVKKAGKESCNCEDAANVDWHLELGAAPGAALTRAAVCEITPREGRLGWTLPRLRALVGKKVTVSGWLMLDTEHLHGAESWRGTEWEVHPVTKLEAK